MMKHNVLITSQLFYLPGSYLQNTFQLETALMNQNSEQQFL